RVLCSDTLRTRQTANQILLGVRSAGVAADDVIEAFALRNPDLYVGGSRVNMVSTPAALAEQASGLSEFEAASTPCFSDFFVQQDPIGWWLNHPDPPGDDAATVAHRVREFAASFADIAEPSLVIAVSHSPLLRAAFLDAFGEDSGEPETLTGVAYHVYGDR